ncbi:MAG: DNA polymerase/3'-5' exonuclease PolX [Candidatus Omnitrophota bacterium]
MKNDLVISVLRSMADFLELMDENPFRIRAYRTAADNVAALEEDIEEYFQEGVKKKIPGVGKDLAGKIRDILSTGTFKEYDQIRRGVPAGVLDLVRVPSVGPKKAKLFYEKLDIASVEGLKKAIADKRISGLPGIKAKTVENIRRGLELLEKGKERLDILTATSVANKFISALKKRKEIAEIAVAGSLRRMKDTVRDVDILIVSEQPKKASRLFTGLPQVRRVVAEGPTRSSVITTDDVQVDLRVIPKDEFGAALLYFTGSKAHNIKLRQLAIKKGWKISEYGLFDKQGRRLASRAEEDIYRKLGMDFIAPELREDSGEIEAASKGALPGLVSLKNILGDFHAHTNYSDGKNSVLEMAQKARSLGYEYLCLTDHSVSLKVAHGLDEARLKRKKKEIQDANRGFKGFSVLFATEAEIDAEGRIDYPEKILSQFDLVIGAIHSGFKQTSQQLTRRIVRACRNRHVDIIAHPTGKLWPTRAPYDIDFEEVFKAAADTGTALEISAYPNRLDLSDVNARRAKEYGVRLAIGTDSHDISHLDYMAFGVGLARRAWLTPKDVLNTLPLKELQKQLKR